MKFLITLLLVGCAAASFHDDNAEDELVLDLMRGMERAPLLKTLLELADGDEVDEETKTELGKQLREKFDKLLEKIKDAMDHGKAVEEDVINKMKELHKKMKEAKVDIGNKAKELLQKIKDKAKELLQKLLDKLGGDRKRAIDNNVETALTDLNLKEILRHLKQQLLEKVDVELIREKIRKLLGQAGELMQQFLDTLREKGRKKLLILIDTLLGEDDEIEKRSVQDLWEKVRDYFKDLNIDLKEKFFKFGEWVKKTIKKGLENTKDKMANIKAIAREVADRSKDVSKEIAVEALEFLRPYKDDLGTLWDDVKESVREVLNRKN